jgi:hypothetical protein
MGAKREGGLSIAYHLLPAGDSVSAVARLVG